MLKLLSSSRITVVSLFLLFILTFWGTVAQVSQGLYGAQERFFNSFFFLAAGFIPFLGAQLILWVLFINLICMTILTFKKYCRWGYAGLLITHFGLLFYFVAAFMVFQVSQESYVRLTQGQMTNVSTSYQDWEFAYWKDGEPKRVVTAMDTKHFKPGFAVPFEDKSLTIMVKDFFLNADAYEDTGRNKKADTLNGSGIVSIVPKPLLKEKEQNVAGGIFDVTMDGSTKTLLLFGNEDIPTGIVCRGKKYNFILRHKQFPLPFTIKLDSFKAEFLPGTSMAKNYESNVTINTGSLERQARIFMNNPLMYKDYTLYQASYDTDKMGRQHTTLAVVKNFAKVLPYVACLIVFLGLAVHFLIQAFLAKARK